LRCSYSIESLVAAVQESTSLAGTLRRLGLKVAGGSSTALKAKIAKLGLDTAHFIPRPGRPRLNPSYVCRHCGRTVNLEQGQRKRTYCSGACLAIGRGERLKRSGARSSFREGIRLVQLKSWGDPKTRERRLAAFATPAAQANRLKSARKAALSPKLRAKRSVNARQRWDDDVEYRNRFQDASKISRRQRSLNETSPRSPHVPYEGPSGTIMVRSKWERDFACWLDLKCLRWQYEPVRVVVDGHPYTPDFFVRSPFGTCYVELHRLTTAQKGDTKIEKMRKAAPLLASPLILVSEDGIKAIRQQLRETL
jgi:DNA-directed RNA polymerase subunit RPC12/RpoP